MKLKEAKEITGGLSNPSKMPGYGYNLPASECKRGSLLADHEDTVCHGCYARKGRYAFSTVHNAMQKRLESILHPDWVEAMTTLIKHYCADEPYFRFHDSGDIQNLLHLNKIVEICRNLPEINFWLPTLEASLVHRYMTSISAEELPKNLTIRVSQPFVGQLPYSATGSNDTTSLPTSCVMKDVDMFKKKAVCPATTERNECGDCRKCWDRKVNNIIYKKH
jgi:hypothetical protein